MPSPTTELLRRLARASGISGTLVLAACAGVETEAPDPSPDPVEEPDPQPPPEPSAESGSFEMSVAIDEPPELDTSPYPATNGTCTERVACFDPWSSCPDSDEVSTWDLGIPFDQCACGAPEGPYTVQGEEPCCYVVTTEACPIDTGWAVGRPFRVADACRMAPMRRSTDWV